MPSAACERCHRRKVRCDKTIPQCGPCARVNASCQYVTSEHQIRRRNIQKLERRIRDLEIENEALYSQLRQRETARREEKDARTTRRTLQTPAAPQSEASSTVRARDEVAEQVLRMSLIAGGGHNFVGPSSGLVLASLLQTCPKPVSFNANGGGAEWEPDTTSRGIASLPSKDLAVELLRAYCSHDHLCYPFLSIPALHRSLDAVYDSQDHADPVDGFFVDMALAIGTAQVHKLNWNGVYDAESHYNRAMTRLADVLSQGGVRRLQALLLICQYRMGTTSSNTTTSVWHLIGVAARTCLEMGLHRASTYVIAELGGDDGSPHYDEHASHEAASRMMEEEMEIKKRCFWSLVALDRVVSLALGRPFAIQLEDIDVDLPHCVSPSDDVPVAALPVSPSQHGSPRWRAAASVFAHIVKYRLICGKIPNALHRRAGGQMGSPSDLEDARSRLAKELQDWHAATGRLPLLAEGDSPQSTSSLESRSSFLSEEWYRLLYHNGVLMLFRPSPYLCDASKNSATLEHIFDSSQEAIGLYASLHRSRRMNYSWITMQSVLNAGLSYVYALRNHLQSLQLSSVQGEEGRRASLHATPTIRQVVNVTRSCSKILVAVSERWKITGECAEIFDRLTDAVVSDMSDLQATSMMPTTAMSNPVTNDVQSDAGGPNAANLASSDALDQMQPFAGFANMTVDSTFRECFGNLQSLGLDEYHYDAIYQLSQDWLFGLGGDAASGHMC